jgi:hypothetical protein
VQDATDMLGRKCKLVLVTINWLNQAASGNSSSRQHALYGKKEQHSAEYSETKPLQVRIQGGFKFLAGIEQAGSLQLQQAAINMWDNATILRDVVSSYISQWNSIKGAPMLVPGLNHALPLLKVIVTSSGGGVLVDVGNHLTEAVWGSVHQLCEEVVNRSCTDILMAVHTIWDDVSENAAKQLVLNAFTQMHNALEIETYAEVKPENESLREYISFKLRKPLQSLATSLVLAGEAFEMQRIEHSNKERDAKIQGMLDKMQNFMKSALVKASAPSSEKT